jgi:hypothetical protein
MDPRDRSGVSYQIRNGGREGQVASPFADESGRATPPRQSLLDGAGVRRGADGRRGRCALPYGERIPRRVNRRDGYRERDWDTGVGSIELAVPKLPAGSYFPDWLSTVLSHDSRAFGNTTLGGVAAREFQNRCPVHDVIVVVAQHRGRGYTSQYVSPLSDSAASDRRNFDAGRRGFRFTSK